MWPISVPVAKTFNIEVFYVNLTAILTIFNTVLNTIISIFIYSKYKPSTGLKSIITVFLVGAIIRASCYFYESFWLVAIGQLLCSSSVPFYANVVTIMVNKWFPDHERALATALLVIGNPLGVAVSNAMTDIFFLNVDENTDA